MRYVCMDCGAGGGDNEEKKLRQYKCSKCSTTEFMVLETVEVRDALLTKLTGHKTDFMNVGHFNCVYCGDLMSLPELNRLECKGKD